MTRGIHFHSSLQRRHIFIYDAQESLESYFSGTVGVKSLLKGVWDSPIFGCFHRLMKRQQHQQMKIVGGRKTFTELSPESSLVLPALWDTLYFHINSLMFSFKSFRDTLMYLKRLWQHTSKHFEIFSFNSKCCRMRYQVDPSIYVLL